MRILFSSSLYLRPASRDSIIDEDFVLIFTHLRSYYKYLVFKVLSFSYPRFCVVKTKGEDEDEVLIDTTKNRFQEATFLQLKKGRNYPLLLPKVKKRKNSLRPCKIIIIFIIPVFDFIRFKLRVKHPSFCYAKAKGQDEDAVLIAPKSHKVGRRWKR